MTAAPTYYNNIDSIINEPLIGEDKRMTEPWVNFFSQFIQKTQQSIGNAANEGLVPPTLTAAQATVVQNGAQNGTIVYDSTTDKLLVRLAAGGGIFHTITNT